MVERSVGLSPSRPIASRILVVDDDSALLDALSSTLQLHLGHTSVDTCATAQHALDRVSAHAYDTVISDVRMPQMDGVHLLKHIHQIRPTTPTILMSGYGDRALLSRAYATGAVDFVFKPIDGHEFLITVRRSLHLSRLRSLIARQEHLMAYCRARYLQRVEVLREYVEARARAFQTGTVLTRPRSLDAKSQTLARRANRSLARLDAHLERALTAHRETLAKLTVAEESCRRLAEEKLTPPV